MLVGVLISHIAERVLTVVFMAAVVLAMFVRVIGYGIIGNSEHFSSRWPSNVLSKQ